jgi:predicted transposase/invertase (TIGR01784 family)
MVRLDPKLDVVFKILFADPSNKDLLLSLLTAVLRPQRPIVDAEVLNPEVPRELAADKGIVLDLRVSLADGRHVDVEMQSDPRPGLRKRAMYYWARMYGSRLFRGMEYTQLEPCISIFFLGYRELSARRFHSIFRVLEVHDQEPFSNQLEIHVVELPKLPEIGNEDRAVEGPLVGWSTFLLAPSEEALQALTKTNPIFEKAMNALESLSAKPDVQAIARERELALLTYKLELAEAIAEGESRGEARGEARGLAEGRAQSLITILVARGLDPSEDLRRRIAACTDLATLERWIARAIAAKSADEAIS